MEKTLFIASFPDLSCFDLGRSGINVCDIDNSDYYFMSKSNSSYVKNYVESLKDRVGTCDVIFVPSIDKVINALEKENIKCIVLYPNIELKERFIEDLYRNNIDPSYISMIESSWDFIISRLDKRDYDYKYMMGEDDVIIDVLHKLLSKKDVLGVSKEDLDKGISETKIDDIFYYCLINEDEMENGKPKVQNVFCEGVKFDFFFNYKRILEKTNEISDYVSRIKDVDGGTSFSKLNLLSDGTKWTDSEDEMEKFFVLGVANGDLVVPFSREYDNILKGSVPYVIKKKKFDKAG